MIFNKEGKDRPYSLVKKIAASLLAFSMVLTTGLSDTYATNESLKPDYNTNIDVNTFWTDSKDLTKEEKSINLNPQSASSYLITQKVTYKSDKIEKEYDAGALSIVVKGIKNLYRDGNLKANSVGADADSSTTKVRDWSYTYNSASDEYTFTNNAKITKDTSLDGFFTLVYQVYPTSTKNGYEQKDISAMLYYPDGTSNKSDDISISNTTIKSSYNINIVQGTVTSNSGLNGYVDDSEKSNYGLYNLLFSSTRTEKSRNLEDANYIVTLPDGVKVCNNSVNAKSIGDNKYQITLVKNNEGNAQKNYMYVAVPGKYLSQRISFNYKLEGKYYDEDDSEIAAEQSLEVQMPSAFSYENLKDGSFYGGVRTDKSSTLRSTKIQSPKGQDENYYVSFGLEKYVENSAGIYDMETVIDENFINTEDGKYRQLKDSEYDIKAISTDQVLNDAKQQVTYGTYEIYACRTWVFKKESAQLVGSGNLSNLKNKSFAMPEGTKSVGIIYTGIRELFDSTYKINVNVHDVEDGVLFNGGNIIRSTYTNGWSYNTEDGSSKTEANFKTDISVPGVDVKKLDNDNYGRTFARFSDNKVMTESQNFMKSESYFYNIKEAQKNVVTAQGRLTAKFDFQDEVNHPTKFSIYSILPEGMNLTDVDNANEVFDNVSLSSSNNLSKEYLAQHCTPEVIKNYKDSGRTYVAFHFDFDDGVLSADERIDAYLNMTLDLQYLGNSGYTGALQSYVQYDDDNTKISKAGLLKDDGKSIGGEIYTDINRDNNTDDLVAAAQYTAAYIYAKSGQQEVLKNVKGSQDSSYKAKTTTEIGKKYTYMLQLRTGSSSLKNIVFNEDLENETEGSTRGTFDSIRFSNGFTGTYDKNKKQIKVNEPMSAGQTLRVFITMTAPKDKSTIGEVLKNKFDVKYTAVTDFEETENSIISNVTSTEITGRQGTVSIKKIDAETGETLSGAEYKIYKKGLTGKEDEPIDTKTTNSKGYANFKNLEYDETYIIEESKAPKGYEKSDKEIEVTLDDDHADENGMIEKTVKDERIKGSLKVTKSSNLDNNIKLSGAEFTVYRIKADGSKEEFGTYTTDKNGEISIKNELPWGDYEIDETKAPDGFSISDDTKSFTISRGNCEQDVKVDFTDIQDDVLVTLEKRVKDTQGNELDETLSGAKFSLYRIDNVSDYDISKAKSYGTFYTNSEGKILVDNIPYGSYVFHEDIAPAGYKNCEDITFTLSSEEKNILLTAYDQRKIATIAVQKTDGKDHIVTGAKFTLYDEENNVIQEKEVDEKGQLVFDDLEWGIYHLKETEAPKGYKVDDHVYDITLKSTHLLERLKITNNQMPGKLKIKKVDKNSGAALVGAEFNVCSNDGSVYASLVTDADGIAVLDNIPWGTYYVEEKKAPEGYTIDKTKRRFAVNYQNAGGEQIITIENEISNNKSFKLTKRANKDDIYPDHGKLVFNYNISYEDNAGSTINRNVSLSFKEGDSTKSTVIDKIPSSVKEVKVFEYDTNRYTLSEVKNGNGDLLEGKDTEGKTYKTYTLSLANDDGTDEIIFKNDKTNWKDYSDSGNVTNSIAKAKQIIGIRATYNHKGSVKARSEINKDEITVKAVYDDGTTSLLKNDDYTINPEKWPNKPGNYVATIRYNGFEDTITGNVDPESIIEDPYLVNRIDYRILNRLKANTVKHLVFTYENAPMDAIITNVEANFKSSIVSWYDSKSYTLYISTQNPNKKIKFQSDSRTLFESLRSLVSIKDVSEVVDTSEVVSMNSMFSSCHDLTDIDGLANWDTSNVTDMGSIFANCYDLTNVNSLKKWNTSKVTNISNMFYNCSRLINISGLSEWDTGHIENMSKAFSRCFKLNSLEGLNNWNTHSTINMSYMFSECEGINRLDALSTWDTECLVNVDGMFDQCYSLTNIDGLKYWATGRIVTMRWMFHYCKLLTNINGLENWDTSNLTDMSIAFYRCDSLVNINGLENWNTSNLIDMSSAFSDCSSLADIKGLEKWNTVNLESVSSMFYNCKSLKNIDYLKNWNTPKLKKMSGLFMYCTSLINTNGLINWNTSRVTSMENVFNKCTNLINVDGLINWDTSNVITMRCMFRECKSLTNLNGLSKWDTHNVVNMDYLFDMDISTKDKGNLSNIDGLKNWNTSNVTSIGAILRNSKIENVDALKNWNISKVTSLGCLFEYCDVLTDLSGLTNWNTINVTNINSMLGGCSSLTNIDALKNWTTDNVTNMASMFSGCGSLTTIDALKNWTTDNVTDMAGMFSSCGSLTTIDALKNWNTINVTTISSMFRNCSSLTDVDALKNWNTIKINNMNSMFAYCTVLRSVDISNWNISNLTDISNMFDNCSDLKTIYTSKNWSENSSIIGSEVFKECQNLIGHDVQNNNIAIRYNPKRIDASMANYVGGYFTFKGNEIILNKNNGEDLERITINKSSELPVPIKNGYIFDGWYYGYKYAISDNDKITIDSFTNPATEYTWTKDNDGVWSSGNKAKANSVSKMISSIFTLNKDGIISFDWRSHGENNYDYLGFDILNVDTGKYLSGKTDPTYKDCLENLRSKSSTDFETITKELSAGTYQIIFMYGKDGSGNSYEDQGFVKNIYYGSLSDIYSNPVGENEDLIMGATLYAKWAKEE